VSHARTRAAGAAEIVAVEMGIRFLRG